MRWNQLPPIHPSIHIIYTVHKDDSFNFVFYIFGQCISCIHSLGHGFDLLVHWHLLLHYIYKLTERPVVLLNAIFVREALSKNQISILNLFTVFNLLKCSKEEVSRPFLPFYRGASLTQCSGHSFQLSSCGKETGVSVMVGHWANWSLRGNLFATRTSIATLGHQTRVTISQPWTMTHGSLENVLKSWILCPRKRGRCQMQCI